MTCSETYPKGAITKTEQLFKKKQLANPAKPWKRSQASPLDHHSESLDASQWDRSIPSINTCVNR